MKKIIIPLFISAILLTSGASFGQNGSITIGLNGTDCNEIVVQWNSTYNFVGTGQNQWTQSTITITWPQALTANVLGNITSLLPGFTGWQYNGAATLVGSEYRREVILINGGYTQNIPTGITEVISIKLVGTGTGTFTIANPNNNTNISSGIFGTGIWSGTFNPSVASNVGLDAKIAWNGTKWCGGSSTTYPGEPSSADGAIACSITGTGGVLHQNGAVVSTLTTNSTGADLTIGPGATLSTTGATTVNGPNSLRIGADATGTGSFIPASISYVGSGSSSASQYFTDFVISVPFQIHLVGPMLYDQAYLTANGHKGQYLSAFNLFSGQSYAYVYDNPTSTWINQSSLTYQVPCTKGIALSTTANTSTTINMSGKFQAGSINTSTGGAIPLANVGYNLTSNPYPSGLNLASFFGTNFDVTGSINEQVWAWEGANNSGGGNYSSYDYLLGTGTGGLTNGIINLGQGFFVDFTGLANVSYTNGMRTHSTAVLLKEEPANLLRLFTRGNEFSDENIVAFKANASSGYGVCDAVKWASMYENATESWTMSSDNVELAINTLEPLGNQMVSVPMSFKCGADADYTIEAANIESFEPGTEIWLEDLKIGGDWYNLVQNPIYTFAGSPSDVHERFILHFFGPTAIDENPVADAKSIQIYSWQHDAYIVNRGTETVKEYIIYDMMGRELQRGTLPNSTVNKVTINDASAYYIVKAITKEGGVYTGKVYITK